MAVSGKFRLPRGLPASPADLRPLPAAPAPSGPSAQDGGGGGGDNRQPPGHRVRLRRSTSPGIATLAAKFSLCQVRILSRVFFCPFSKNSSPPSKKIKLIFGKKTQHYGGNFGYQEKNLEIFYKNIQNLFKISLDIQ